MFYCRISVTGVSVIGTSVMLEHVVRDYFIVVSICQRCLKMCRGICGGIVSLDAEIARRCCGIGNFVNKVCPNISVGFFVF